MSKGFSSLFWSTYVYLQQATEMQQIDAPRGGGPIIWGIRPTWE